MTKTPEPVKVDARSRAIRTLQNSVPVALAFVLVTVGPTLLASVAGSESFSEVDWGAALDRALLVLFVGALTAGVSWSRRIREGRRDV